MARAKANSEVLNILRTVPIFSACSPKELRTIAEVVKEVEFPSGRVICKEGETGIGMHVVVTGETKVSVGGRTRSRLGPGAFFGEIALLDGGPRTATVTAETPVKTLSLPSWSFKAVIKSQPGIALKMLEETCRRLRAVETSLNN
jgi:CRP-like cAMP-binding protein